MPSQDSIYKNLYAHPEVLEALFRHYGPKGLVDSVDFSAMTEISTELLGEENQKRRSDLIFKLPFGNSSSLYLVILLEVQKDQYSGAIVLRVLEYCTLIWKSIYDKSGSKTRLPPIFPVVLHTGNRRFTRPTNLKDLLSPYPKFLSQYIPQFEFYLVDEYVNRDKAKQGLDLASVLIQANQTQTSEDYLHALRSIEMLSEHENLRGMTKQILKWLYKISQKKIPGLSEEVALENLDVKEGLKMLEHNFEKMKQHEYEKGFIVGTQEGRQEGRQEGLEKGLEQGLQRGQLEGTLKTILQFYLDGDVSREKTEKRIKSLLGQGQDELVQSYLKML
ncbi:MAG: Rpn family recombination-promoting nuclease/putative transposase [Candidatus Cloacimonetes bacterium]|nr:Rpn family recombination-promoting nuclease/putative transposase [Candidatus Cloacimonadota bacterium]